MLYSQDMKFPCHVMHREARRPEVNPSALSALWALQSGFRVILNLETFIRMNEAVFRFPLQAPWDLPGQVEGIIHQLSSVNHWNKLKQKSNTPVTTKTTQIKMFLTSMCDIMLQYLNASAVSYLMLIIQSLQEFFPVVQVIVDSVVAHHIIVGQDPVVA